MTSPFFLWLPVGALRKFWHHFTRKSRFSLRHMNKSEMFRKSQQSLYYTSMFRIHFKLLLKTTHMRLELSFLKCTRKQNLEINICKISVSQFISHIGFLGAITNTCPTQGVEGTMAGSGRQFTHIYVRNMYSVLNENRWHVTLKTNSDKLEILFGRISYLFGQISYLFGQIRYSFGQIRNLFGRIRNLFGRISYLFGQIRDFVRTN
jgi:hypothetical protein